MNIFGQVGGLVTSLFAQFGAWIAGLLLLFSLAGCTITTTNGAEYEFSFGTSIKLSSMGSHTSGAENPGVANLEFPALEEWIFSQADKDEMGPPAPEPAPEPTPAPDPTP